MPVGEAGRQEPPERGVLLERCDHLVVDLIGLDQLPHALRQLLRQHALVLQRPQPLEHDRRRGDGAQNDRPHQRAAGPYYFPHPKRPQGPVIAEAASYLRGAAAQGNCVADAPGHIGAPPASARVRGSMPRRYLQKITPDPASLRELWFLRPFAQRLSDPQLWTLHRRGVTYAFGAGLAICFIPLPVHLGTACAVALLWRLNLPVVCGTTFLLNPFTAVPVYYGA